MDPINTITYETVEKKNGREQNDLRMKMKERVNSYRIKGNRSGACKDYPS